MQFFLKQFKFEICDDFLRFILKQSKFEMKLIVIFSEKFNTKFFFESKILNFKIIVFLTKKLANLIY